MKRYHGFVRNRRMLAYIDITNKEVDVRVDHHGSAAMSPAIQVPLAHYA